MALSNAERQKAYRQRNAGSVTERNGVTEPVTEQTQTDEAARSHEEAGERTAKTATGGGKHGAALAPARQLVWPEGSEFEPAEGVHCDRCGYPAGRYTPPLDDRTGYRRLGTDPRGWHRDHGPDVGLGCCRTLICYDARPGHRVWPK